VFFVGLVFRIETLDFFGYAVICVAVEVNGNEGNARRRQILAFRKGGGFGSRFLRGQRSRTTCGSRKPCRASTSAACPLLRLTD